MASASCSMLKVNSLILSIHYLYVIMGLPSQATEIKEGEKMLEICRRERNVKLLWKMVALILKKENSFLFMPKPIFMS